MFKFKELDPRLKLTWCLFLVLTALVSRSMILNGVLLGLILISELLSEKSLRAFKISILYSITYATPLCV